MIQRFLLVAVMLGMLTGCVDTIDSVAREYRNEINECIDAMMMVTNEASAKEMTIRVFKPSLEKFQGIDKKLKVFEANRETLEFVKEAIDANGFYLLESEYDYNRQRYALEKTRLRHVRDEIVNAQRDKLIAEGNANPAEAAANCCPKLDELLRESSPLSSLEAQLKTPPMPAKLDQIKTRLKPKDREELNKKYDEKKEQFNKGKKEVEKLVN